MNNVQENIGHLAWVGKEEQETDAEQGNLKD
jgi:hypothetical protein